MKKILFLIVNNETLILLDRLKYDAESYEKIYVFEANKTFSGDAKELFIKKHLQIFSDATSKFTYVPILDLPDPERSINLIGSNDQLITENRWVVEHAMRNYAMRFFDEIELAYGLDVLLTFCDVDEIVSGDELEKICLKPNQIHTHLFHEFRMSISSEGYKKDGPIRGGFSTLLRTFKENEVNINNLRSAVQDSDGNVSSWNIATSFCLRHLDGSPYYNKIHYPNLKHTISSEESLYGWHLTSMHGGFKILVGHKVENFSHSEYSKGIKIQSPDLIQLLLERQISVDPIDWSQVISLAPLSILRNSIAPNFYLPGP